MFSMLGKMCQLPHTLEGFVEVEAEVGEDDPQLLPPVRVLKLPGDDDIESYDHDDDIERYGHDDDIASYDDDIESYDDET